MLLAQEHLRSSAPLEHTRHRVHADMVFFETEGGGAVFSTGSMTWIGSLSHNEYDNNVERITSNVLQRFTLEEAFVPPLIGPTPPRESLQEREHCMPHFTTSGANVYYEQAGEGPDIVWLPGGDQRGRDMRWQIEGFADFRNTSMDPRGAGETAIIDAPPWSILDMARDCAELIEARCDPPVVVAGLSMGSMIVQEVAINWPELVRVAIPMGTEAYAEGHSREWMESEIRYRREHGDLPPDFAMTHYGAFMYPSEVLGDVEPLEQAKGGHRRRLRAPGRRAAGCAMAGLL